MHQHHDDPRTKVKGGRTSKPMISSLNAGQQADNLFTENLTKLLANNVHGLTLATLIGSQNPAPKSQHDTSFSTK